MRKFFEFLLISLLFSSCSFVASFTGNGDENIELSLDKDNTSVNIGAMEVLNLTASKKQNSADIRWEYDESIIFAKTDNYSAVITGLAQGSTTITAYCGSNRASCQVTVSSDSYTVSVTNPYVYASQDYVEVSPGNTTKISAALFGGTMADINGYSFSIDKPSVASISYEGNYCWITGVNDGIAKLSVTHTKAAYSYSVLINCSSDGTDPTYITTNQNILTINMSETTEKTFSVSLVNPLKTEYASSFEYKIVDENGKELSDGPISIKNILNLDITLTAKQVGTCYIRCSHPDAVYSLDILVRVIENAETAYIEPTSTLVTVSDKEYETIDVTVQNYENTVSSNLFEWKFSENADQYIDYTIYNGSTDTTGDKISIKGIKTGTVKITVSYPGLSSRSIVVLIRDIETEASDAKTYITTSQNYLKFSMEDEPVTININLSNASVDDIEDLHWKITNTASDGSSNEVIKYKNGNGKSESVSSRSVVESSASAYAVIEPVNPGTATIDISHPKALYSTQITVVVTEKKEVAVEKTYLNIKSSPVLYIKQGSSATAQVSITGNGSADDIVWSSDGKFTIASNGTECVITAPDEVSELTKNTLTVSHPNCNTSVTFIVVCYSSEEELENLSIKYIYSYLTNATLKTDGSFTFYIEEIGLEDTDSISISVTDGKDLIDFETSNNNKNIIVYAKKAGQAIIKASAPDCDGIIFVIDIIEDGVIDVEKDCYISTSSNVLYFDKKDQTQELTIDFFNIDESTFSKTSWVLSNEDFEVVSNNNSFSVTSLKEESSATLTISHPLSENSLIVYLKSGSQYEYVNEDVCYISSNQETFEFYEGQAEATLIVNLNHTEQNESTGEKGFSFECEDEKVASISYVNYSNTCYIKPLKNGTTKIKVSHESAAFEKEIVVIVNPAPDVSTIPYITTSSNVITVIQGEYTTLSASLVNSSSIDNLLWSWSSSDSNVADIIANNGTSALLCANGPGTVKIKISHKECIYSLEIIVIVLDSAIAQSKPYISVSQNIITLQKGESTTLTAEMMGGSSDSDNNYFRFSPSNSSMVLVGTASSGSVYVKGLSSGLSYITISNSRYQDSYSKSVLIVVEDTQETGVYITASQNIVKLKPDSTETTIITATLENGEATDGEDFIWWADDYNLISIKAIAEQCSISPTGRSGTTKLHIKHGKAAKQVDILVMISSYDEFAFSSTSANISTEKLYFYPLEVPAIEEEFEIKYSSSNESVCVVSGSDSVAWVCGLDYGQASLTAKMVTKSDGTVLATAEMLVSVEKISASLPTVSLGDSIITVESGTSQTISAIISGDNIDSTEKYNLEWTVKNKDKGISFLNENDDKVVYGSDVYVTFNYGGEYVLTCTHSKTGVSAELYVIVEEKGEVLISLNSSLETIYRDDGSFSLTATLTNGSTDDYNNIEWSAVKVGGLQIVSVSKNNGASCTVYPRNIGQTIVIAKLPSGKTAQCIVIVKASAEITLDVGSIHVIPGYTEVVNYKTNPENATITWYHTQTNYSSIGDSSVSYFSYEDDTVNKQLRITGLKEYVNGAAGTIKANLMGAASSNIPTINVYVNYDVDLKLQDLNGNNLTVVENTCPDTSNVKKFNIIYYPKDLDIDIKNDNGEILSCIPYDKNELNHTVSESASKQVSIGDVEKTIIEEDGFEKVCMTVSLIPHTETKCNLNVTATLPSDTTGSYAESRSFVYKAYYSSYDIEVIDLTSSESGAGSGAFTKFTKDPNTGNIKSLTLSDGEEAIFYFKIKNENAAGKIENATYKYESKKSYDLIKSDTWNSAEKRNQERGKKGEIYFDIQSNKELYTIQTDKKIPKEGLIGFYSDTSSVENTTVYHLSHNWDYYKDLPEALSGDSWETFKEENVYSNDFFDNENVKQVDYWLISRELVYNDDYYAVPHGNGELKLNVNWESGCNKEDSTEWFVTTYYYNCWVKLLFNNELVYRHENRDHGSKLNSEHSSPVDALEEYYQVCVPYVITTSELKSNQALVTPTNYQSILYNETKGWGGWTNLSGDTARNRDSMPKLLSKYITPTVSKDSSVTETQSGASIVIEFSQANGITTSPVVIPVTFQKRLCEAYTNDNWYSKTVSGNKHWVISEDLFDKSSLAKKNPSFNVLTDEISCKKDDITEEKLTVSYRVYPASSEIEVVIPNGEKGSLSIKDGYYNSCTTTSSAKVYKISPNGSNSEKKSGEIIFEVEGVYSNSVSLTAIGTTSDGENLNKTKSIKFSISSEDKIVPYIEKKCLAERDSFIINGYDKYGRLGENILVIEDGEKLTGYFTNLSSESDTKITNVEYVPFSSNSDGGWSAASEKNLSVSVNESSDKWNFTLSHSYDYGYFQKDFNPGYNYKFYQKTFMVSQYGGDREKFHNAKLSYANSATSPLTKTKFPYYYENYKYVKGEKEYPYTAVGRFIITTDKVYTDSDNNEQNVKTEIIVCVKIMDKPYVTSTVDGFKYGYTLSFTQAQLNGLPYSFFQE